MKKIKSKSTILNMHCCRKGPVLSNDLDVIIGEFNKNKNIKSVLGVMHPGGTIAQYFLYWFSGLSSLVALEILSGVRIINKGFILNDKGLNFNLLASKASDCMVNFREFVSVLLDSIILDDDFYVSLHKNNLLSYIIFLKKQISKDKVCSIEESMIFVGEKLINAFLINKNLPKLKTIKTSVDFLNSKGFSSFYIDSKAYLEYIKKIEKRFNLAKDIAVKEINKLSNHSTDINLIINAHQTLLLKNNTACSKFFVKNTRSNLKNVRLRTNVKNLQEVIFPRNISLILKKIIESEKKFVLKNKKNKTDYPFITGTDMVDYIYYLADKNDYPVSKQKFIRNSTYEIYTLNEKKYPNVDSDWSPVTTWNRRQFPNFDKNIFVGIKNISK